MDTKNNLTAHWLDFVSDLDPLAGRQMLATAAGQSFRIRSQSSCFTAHWTYWRSTEEFALPIVTALMDVSSMQPDPAAWTRSGIPSSRACGTTGRIRSMGYAYSRGWRGLTIIILRPSLHVMLRRDWRGGSNIPRTGGLIVAANHISESDPIPVAHFLYENGRYPVYLAKSALFSEGFTGKIMRETGQIPVDRGSPEAAVALEMAQDALAAGQCVVIYPEGTCTREPDLWPMTGRTGVARLALTTGVPVIPLASWGAHELLPYRKGERGGLAESLKPGLHLLPRKKMQVVTGPPVDLTEYESQPLTATIARTATFKIMSAITHLLEELRDEHAPAYIYESLKS